MSYAHIIAIASFHPELIKDQVRSYVDNAVQYDELYGKKMLIVVVSDRTDRDADREYRGYINEVKQFIKEKGVTDNVDIAYLSYEEQMAMYFRLSSGSLLSGEQQSSAEFFLKDYGKDKIGGVRGNQNKCDLLMRLFPSAEGAILHKIDDDIYPLSLNVTENTILLRHAHNFFGERHKLLSSDEVSFLGSPYSGDTPSLISPH